MGVLMYLLALTTGYINISTFTPENWLHKYSDFYSRKLVEYIPTFTPENWLNTFQLFSSFYFSLYKTKQEGKFRIKTVNLLQANKFFNLFYWVFAWNKLSSCPKLNFIFATFWFDISKLEYLVCQNSSFEISTITTWFCRDKGIVRSEFVSKDQLL